MPSKPRPTGHVFGRPRPSHSREFRLHLAPPRDVRYRDLPNPTAKARYRLDLALLPPDAEYKTIGERKKLTLHLNGDMGGINYDASQLLVAKGMEAVFDPKKDAA